MFLNRLSLLGFLIVLISISVQAQKVSVGYDHAIDFSKFKTYYWTKGMPAKNPDIDKRIIELVDQQMTIKGLTRAASSGDLALSYHAAVMDTFDSATVARPGTWGASAGSVEAAWRVVKGALIVEMKDSTNTSEVWRATARETISNEPSDPAKDREKVNKKLQKVVEKIFKFYPPKK